MERYLQRIGEDGADEERLFRNLWDNETQREVVLESLKNRFQNVAYTNNRPQRTLGTEASTQHRIRHCGRSVLARQKIADKEPASCGALFTTL